MGVRLQGPCPCRRRRLWGSSCRRYSVCTCVFAEEQCTESQKCAISYNAGTVAQWLKRYVYNPLEVSSCPSVFFVLLLKKECSPFFVFLSSLFSPGTSTFHNPTVRSRWTHTCYIRHKYCCTPAVALVHVVLGYGSNACLHNRIKTYTCTYVPRASRNSHVERGIRALLIRVPPLQAYDTAEVPHRP